MTDLAVGTALGGLVVALAYRLFQRTLLGSHEAFLKAFGLVFAVKTLLFGALLLLAWKAHRPALLLVGSYALVAVGGTLAVTSVLERRLRRAARAG